MRDPALHISRSKLVLVLREVLGAEAASKVDLLFKAATPYQIKDRYLVEAKSVACKKLKKNIETESHHVDMFNRVLVSVRMSVGHKYITPITKADTSYILLNEIARHACEFSEVFKIQPLEEAFTDFCKIGLKLMGKSYGLSKFKYYKEQIFEVAKSILAIEGDTNKEGTLQLINIYSDLLEQNGAPRINLEKMAPEKYMHFIYARQEADEAQASYYDWVYAQFVELNWMGKVPEMSQLHTENARNRYFKNKVSVVKTEALELDMPTGGTEAEQAYYAMMQGKKR